MALSPDDQEALQHEKVMLKIRTRNLRELEKQEATYGLDTRPHLRAEIEDITEKIARHKSEIDRLETLNVQGETPLNEVEYRVILAEAWDTPMGKPTVAGNARKEFARLRLHITEVRSREIEWDVRKLLFLERTGKGGDINERMNHKDVEEFDRYMTDQDDFERNFGIEFKMVSLLQPYINLHPASIFTYLYEYFYWYRDETSLMDGPYWDRWLPIITQSTPREYLDDTRRQIHAECYPDQPFDSRRWVIPRTAQRRRPVSEDIDLL